MEKIYINANALLNDAYELGFQIIEDNFKPDLLLAIWRGGTPVGIAIQELFAYKKIDHEHFALRTRHYNGIDSREQQVTIYDLDTILNHISPHQKILIVDDVFDTGLSINTLFQRIEEHCPHQTPEIRVATPYFKPGNNKTQRLPNYYLHSTDQWLVFPHEIEGLSLEEILTNKADIPAFTKYKHLL